MLLFLKQCFSFPFVCLYCRICWTHIVNEDSKIVVKYSSERAQINQSFCIKQQQSCFCHEWEPEGDVAADPKRSHQWCATLTPNNTKTMGRMTCHCFQWPIRRDLRISCYTTGARRWHLIIMIRSFIYHFWSVFITSFWVGQINCVWGSLHVLATGVVCLSWLVFFSETVYIWITHVVFQVKGGLD